MRCAIMQPTYLPWLGYFELIDSTDVFVLLDNVKLEKSSWHVRNNIRSANGKTTLTVPVSLTNGRLHTLINEAQINTNLQWKQKHLRSIEQNYCKTKYFDAFFPMLEDQINRAHQNLASLNAAVIRMIAAYLGISTSIILASSIEDVYGAKDLRLLSICKKLRADLYYSPRGSSIYLDRESVGGVITNAGIHVVYQDFVPTRYPQQFKPFLSHMSVVDAIFNCGAAGTYNLIQQGRRTVMPI